MKAYIISNSESESEREMLRVLSCIMGGKND